MTIPLDRPIRVMRIIARMNVGGPAVQVTGLMRGFDPIEFDQRLYAGFCDANEADYLELVAKDLPVIRIRSLGRRVNILGDIRALLTIVREIRSFKPDIIHTHTAKAGVLGRMASLISMHSSLRVHTFHGHLLYGYFGSLKLTIIIFLERSLSKFTDQLLAVGQKVRQDLLDVRIGSEARFGLMSPGLSIGPLPSKSKSLDFFEIESDDIICGFIGRVTKIKRPDRFLKVVSELKRRGVRIQFFMAGDGDMLDSCREIILNEGLPVSVLGWQSDIEKLLSVADMVILTSDNEGTPLSLIQAGMAGLPVVSTNVGSVSEVVLHNITGLITSQDVQQIADAIEKLVASAEFRATLGERAREFTLSHFGVERLVHEHQELYKNLISNRAKS
jgi:glycosyltransferase involved in cell wall biosynthesis